MTPLHALEEVADHFGITPDQVIRRCKSPVNPWPHVKVNQRDASTWRFSDDDVAEIENRLARHRVPVDSWGREQRRRVSA